MLFFLDQPRLVKIVRVTRNDRGRAARKTIGSLHKSSLKTTLDETAKVTQDEATEIEGALEVYKRGYEARRQYHALNFPEIVRETLEYFENGASEAERELITVALSEALRKVQRLGRRAD